MAQQGSWNPPGYPRGVGMSLAAHGWVGMSWALLGNALPQQTLPSPSVLSALAAS